MSPIIGSLGAGVRSYGMFGASAGVASFELIDSVIVATATSSVTFASIPQTYASLHIRYLAKDTTTSTTPTTFRLQFNLDNAGNYTNHYFYGDGSAASATGLVGSTAIAMTFAIPTSGGGGLSNTFGVGLIDIHDYASTTRNKTVRTQYGADANTASVNYRMTMHSGLWLSTSAINRIGISGTGIAFETGTVVALYGIKGAS